MPLQDRAAAKLKRLSSRAPVGTEGGLINAERADVVVLTAIPAEYRAVREHLAGPLLSRAISGTRYEIGTYHGTHRVWTVAIAEIGAGNEPAGIPESGPNHG